MGNKIQKEQTKLTTLIKQLKVPNTLLPNHIVKFQYCCEYKSVTDFNDICNQFLESVDYKSEHIWSKIDKNQQETQTESTTCFSIFNFYVYATPSTPKYNFYIM